MTEDQYDARLHAIEVWATAAAAEYQPAVESDPKPGAGEPGHVYNIVKAMAYEQRHAKQVALIAAVLAHLESVLVADFYGMQRPVTESGSAEIDAACLEREAFFDRVFSSGRSQ